MIFFVENNIWSESKVSIVLNTFMYIDECNADNNEKTLGAIVARMEMNDGRQGFQNAALQILKDFLAKPISQLRVNYCAVADLADGHILFSWNHYYTQDPELNAQFTAYTFETIPGDVNGDEAANSDDAVLVLKYTAGIITSFPAQE